MKSFIESLPFEDDMLQAAFEELTSANILQVSWDRVVFSSGSKSPKS